MMPKQREKENSASQQHNVAQYLSMLAVPAMYLFFKYSEYKKQKQRSKTVTEKELDNLNQRINKLLAKIDTTENDTSQSEIDEDCVICFSAKATIHTFPCSHKVVCRKCFIKTIQMAVSQRCLPLQCVVCRARILKLRQESSIKKPKSLVKSHLAKTFFPSKNHQNHVFRQNLFEVENEVVCRKSIVMLLMLVGLQVLYSLALLQMQYECQNIRLNRTQFVEDLHTSINSTAKHNV